ncbi:biliverdin-producing heme oxygenase [Gramella sp. GC03-9]|uniref:Biliverdin-producing heme oxygenase n=1 Tax=Christiangramia oceanisediminis TaxID=2920386 RepID=A0A9X2KXH7_9FLAO|nr:biliverdin-producing heme oxygenase [Gramella oceanisediminis]MCP9199936.1 biliverdin-producing heme oxygenase [Gramella oceanisediminis]
MKILDSLRQATAELHHRLEGENLTGKIMDHSISLEEYKLLIYQNFIAYRSVEKAISGFLPIAEMQKTSQLEKDLKSLGVPVPGEEHDIHFDCKDEMEAIGAAYVLEGSAMGGLMIGKELKNCQISQLISEQHFFSGERSSMAGWNKFLKFLRSREFDQNQVNKACDKAKETFLLFEQAFDTVPGNC